MYKIQHYISTGQVLLEIVIYQDETSRSSQIMLSSIRAVFYILVIRKYGCSKYNELF
jgi:hypothetical protein